MYIKIKPSNCPPRTDVFALGLMFVSRVVTLILSIDLFLGRRTIYFEKKIHAIEHYILSRMPQTTIFCDFFYT